MYIARRHMKMRKRSYFFQFAHGRLRALLLEVPSKTTHLRPAHPHLHKLNVCHILQLIHCSDLSESNNEHSYYKTNAWFRERCILS